MKRARAALGGPAALLSLVAGCGGSDGEPARPTAEGGDAPPAAPLDLRFEDATAAAGIDFVHVTGGYGEKLLPETLGAGACFLDQDADGALDLFLVQGAYWPGHVPEGAAVPRCALWRGRGDATFEDVSARTGADVALYGMGASAADYDGDGREDLFVTALRDNVLLGNRGERFRDVTAAAGVAGGRWTDGAGREHPEWSTASAWFDADADGDLELFVANYCQWTPELEIFTTLDGVHKAFTTPDRYTGLPCRLWANDGDGTFTEVALAGADGAPLEGKALGVTIWDFDGDGRLDVAVANDTRPNFLFMNEGGLVFEERGVAAGIAYDENGRARAGMGIDVADLGDGSGAAVAIGNFAGEPMSLYRAAPDAAFRSEAARAGLAQPTIAPLTFGLAFLDLDLDGWQDLVVVNGHIEPDIGDYRTGETHAQPPQLFRGLPGGRFEDVSARVGADFSAPRVGRGLAAGDVDGDGDLDLVVTENGGRARLLLNRAQEIRPRRWLRVELAGPRLNARALGATLLLEAGGRAQRRLVRSGSSYLSQSEAAAVFGLGTETEVEALRVRWPDGTERSYAVDGIDRTVRLTAE